MLLTALTIAGIVGALVAVYVLTAKATQAPALAGETTVVGLADPAADTLASGRMALGGTRTDWQLTTVNNLTDAEELLDVLENQGISERELVVLGNSCFTVRWR